MFPCQEIRNMIAQHWPDFVKYNNLRQKKGLPRVTWADYTDLRNDPRGLQRAMQGLFDDGVHPYQDTIGPQCRASVEPLEGELLLTKDMEVQPESGYQEVSILDASGPIQPEYET